MPAPSGIETQAEARIRLMLKNSPTFLAWLGGGTAVSVETAAARIHFRQVIENRNPANPIAADRPLAIIHSPQFHYHAAAIGPRREYKVTGGIRLMLETQIVGKDPVIAEQLDAEFRAYTGQIRKELVELNDDPLGTSEYIAFQTIECTLPPSRTPEKDRTESYDFFAVGWRFALPGGEGE